MKLNEETDPAKIRVLIAKDVIKFLDAGKIKSRHGEYMILSKKDIVNLEAPLEKVLKKKKTCQVCALGSLLYAQVNRFNKVKIGDIGKENNFGSAFVYERFKVMMPLLDYFSSDQLRLIENNFEGWDYFNQKATERMSLKNIMKNIIKNKGEFIPNGPKG